MRALILALAISSCAAAPPPVLDEKGEEVPKELVKCWDVVHFEPDQCNAYGARAFEIMGCEYAGFIRICGQWFPESAEEAAREHRP